MYYGFPVLALAILGFFRTAVVLASLLFVVFMPLLGFAAGLLFTFLFESQEYWYALGAGLPAWGVTTFLDSLSYSEPFYKVMHLPWVFIVDLYRAAWYVNMNFGGFAYYIPEFICTLFSVMFVGFVVTLAA
jgi:hypothetical protein